MITKKLKMSPLFLALLVFYLGLMYEITSISQKGHTLMKSTFMRMILLSFLLILFLPNIISAEMKTFIKEYSYQASDEDSKNSSRTISLREVKRLLLEELGTYLESITEVQNFQLTKDQITMLTAGIVQTEIVDEKWDGHTYWLKSKIKADSGDVIKSIDSLRKDRQKTQELEQVKKRTDELLREVERLRKELSDVKDVNREDKKAAYDDVINGLTAVEWYEKGRAKYLDDRINAINAYTKAIELDPNFAEAYSGRGFAYLLLGNYLQAIGNYDKVIELDPNHTRAYLLRGESYFGLGSYKQALVDFDKAIELTPEFAPCYSDRGAAYAALGNYRQAIDDFDRAIDLDPNNSHYYFGRGTAYNDLVPCNAYNFG
jgi:tetratricopeptide (TPR) repeat protein